VCSLCLHKLLSTVASYTIGSQKVCGIHLQTKNEIKDSSHIVVVWSSAVLPSGATGLDRFRRAVSLLFRLS
jgi:hypothetical protein